MDMLKVPLAAYIAHRYGSEASVHEAVKFPRGSSRETWFVSCRRRKDEPETKLVFRTDLPSGSTIPSSLEQEYYISERLGQTAVPVARVLWWEDDPKWAARPFYVREHIEGSWSIPHYHDPDPAYDELRIEVSKEHVRKLSLVHQVDWRRLGLGERLPVPVSEAEAATACIALIESQLDEFRKEPMPMFVAGADWLRRRGPVAPCLSLCKGTNGLGEEVFRNGEIVAMSDWEEAAIGDPASDFAYAQNFFSEIERDGRRLWGLEQALDYYYSVSGIRVTAAAVDYYRKVNFLKMLMYTHRAAVGTHTTADAGVRQAWTATEVAHVAKRLMAATMGLGDPLPGSRFIELNNTLT
jgi:aminoglycoside phosphotransferase (APT) family kinase protein